MIRFLHFFGYAAGVSKERGEAWYLGEHVPQAESLPGVMRYRSWKALEAPSGFPGTGVAPIDQFARMSELCFADLNAARQAIVGSASLWTPSPEGKPGFGEFEAMFVDEEPQFDLLRDVPHQQYKYMSLPMMWPKGIPEVEDTDDIIADVYFLSYRTDISLADAEDWYIGHHNREGKQLPGVKHYKTWKAIRVDDAGLPFRPNRFFRVTELGYPSFKGFVDTLRGEQRVRFTPSPLGRVIEEWRNVFLNLNVVEDLMK